MPPGKRAYRDITVFLLWLVLTCSLLACQDNNLCISLWRICAKMLVRPVDNCGLVGLWKCG